MSIADRASSIAQPETAVLGAGSLGLLWASRLSSVCPVTLISRSGNGLCSFDVLLPGINGQLEVHEHFELPRISGNAPASPYPLVLVCTKSFDTLEAIKGQLTRVQVDGTLVLLQNGMGSQQEVEHYVEQHRPDIHLYAMSTTEGANRPTPGKLVYAGKGESWIGPLNRAARESDRSSYLASLFSRATMCTHAELKITLRLWQKLVINCGINPFTALLNCPNGDILTHPFFCEQITALSKELSRVCTHYFQSSYTQFFSPEAIKQAVYGVATKTAPNISSMLQDVRNGRRTEIDYMNGYICRYAEAHGIPTPINKRLTDDVRQLVSTGAVEIK